MSTLHVRNVPDELYEQLQRRAQAEGRSLSAEVINLLQYALQRTQRTQGEILADIRRRRAKHPYNPDIPDSLQLLREARDR